MAETVAFPARDTGNERIYRDFLTVSHDETFRKGLTFPNFSAKMGRNVRKGGDRVTTIMLRQVGARQAFSGKDRGGRDGSVRPFSLAPSKG